MSGMSAGRQVPGVHGHVPVRVGRNRGRHPAPAVPPAPTEPAEPEPAEPAPSVAPPEEPPEAPVEPAEVATVSAELDEPVPVLVPDLDEPTELAHLAETTESAHLQDLSESPDLTELPDSPDASLVELAASVEWPDHEAEAAARARLGAPARDGRLATVAEWLCGVQSRWPPRDFARPRLVVFASDHGIAAAGVSTAAAGSTGAQAAAMASGADPYGALAEFAATGVRLIDVGLNEPVQGVEARAVRRGTGRIDVEDALTRVQVDASVATGAAVADEEIDSGADLLLVAALGVGGSTAADTLVSVLTATEPVKAVGRGSGIDDDAWMRKTAAVRDARRRALEHRSDPTQLLAVCGGPDLAAIAGFLLRAAARRTPVVIDGVVALAAALVAHEVSPRAMRWWAVAQEVPGRDVAATLSRVGLRPVLDLGLARGDGVGALVCVPVLRAAVHLAGGDTPA